MLLLIENKLTHAFSGAAQHFVPAVDEHSIALFSVDQLGHGTSEGLKGYIPSFQSKLCVFVFVFPATDPTIDLVLDFGAFVDTVIARYPGVPLFLSGESMGGAVLLKSVLDDGPLYGKAQGCIFIAPMWYGTYVESSS